MAKKQTPAKRNNSSRKSSSKKLPQTRWYAIPLLVAIGVAVVGMIFTFLARANNEFPTGGDEVVVEYRREKPTLVEPSTYQKTVAQTQPIITRVLGDGTVECAQEDQDVVTTAKLPGGQLKQLYNEVIESGVRELPDSAFMGDDTVNFVGAYESITINSSDEPKTILMFDGAERPAKFNNIVRTIQKRCENATERKTRSDLKRLKGEEAVEQKQSLLDKVLKTQTASAATAGGVQSIENDQLSRIASHRASHGRSGLTTSGCMTAIARIHAKRMADRGQIYHNPNIANEVNYACSSGGAWNMLGENVGVGYDPDSAGLFQAFLNSAPHHENIDRSNWHYKAVGAYRTTDGRIWVVQMYAQCNGCGGAWNSAPSYVGDPAPPVNTPPKYFKWDRALPKHSVSGDYDGNGTIDAAMWSKATGNWYIKDQPTVQWGDTTGKDAPIPGDYNGDGKADYATWRQPTKTFYIRNIGTYAFGLSTDVPVTADYNGDRKTEIAVFRASNGTWYLRGFGSGGATWSYTFGQSQGDIPLPADYNGDGKADMGIFRNGTWYAKTTGGTYIINASGYGTSGDIPLPADYNGDKKADRAVWRPSNKVWYIKSIAEGTPAFGQVSGDVAAVADYNNDGKANIAILRPGENTIYYRTIPQDSTTNQSIKVVP